jgi:hypothetical protein
MPHSGGLAAGRRQTDRAMILEGGDCKISPASLPPKVVDPASQGVSRKFPQELSFHLRILEAAKPMAVRNKWNRLIHKPRKN